jgi:hypothetical protein
MIFYRPFWKALPCGCCNKNHQKCANLVILYNSHNAHNFHAIGHFRSSSHRCFREHLASYRCRNRSLEVNIPYRERRVTYLMVYDFKWNSEFSWGWVICNRFSQTTPPYSSILPFGRLGLQIHCSTFLPKKIYPMDPSPWFYCYLPYSYRRRLYHSPRSITCL